MQKITNNNYTITTIYFDGQFWCALIEKCIDGDMYIGRYIFGEEPSNPRIIDFGMNDFLQVPLLKVGEKAQKIRYKKLAKRGAEENRLPKSLVKFSAAQAAEAKKKKIQKKKVLKLEAREKYLKKRKKKKNAK